MRCPGCALVLVVIGCGAAGESPPADAMSLSDGAAAPDRAVSHGPEDAAPNDLAAAADFASLGPLATSGPFSGSPTPGGVRCPLDAHADMAAPPLCVNGQVCCATIATECLAAANCGAPRLECDGPEDCPAPAVCCAWLPQSHQFSMACRQPGDCVEPARTACNIDSDCAPGARCCSPGFDVNRGYLVAGVCSTGGC